MECYCVAKNKPIRRVITTLQTATVISLWFWGLIAYPKLYCNWPVHSQHSWNFSCVHGFLSLIVKRRPKLNNFWLKKYKIKLKRIALTTLISYMCIEVKYGLSYGITMKIIEKIKQTRAILTWKSAGDLCVMVLNNDKLHNKFVTMKKQLAKQTRTIKINKWSMCYNDEVQETNSWKACKKQQVIKNMRSLWFWFSKYIEAARRAKCL